MEYLKKLFRSAKNKLPKPNKLIISKEPKLSCSFQTYEKYLYTVQRIVRWEEPAESVLYVILVNTLFWFLTCIHWKFYGLLFTLLCSFVVHQAWTEHIWPEIRQPEEVKMEIKKSPAIPPEGILSAAELNHYAVIIKDAVYLQCRKLLFLRSSQPPVYCALVSLACLVVAGVGTFLSGIALIYLLTMAFMILPGMVRHFLSDEHKKKLTVIMHSLYSILMPAESVGNFDEYMPESTKENLALLSQAGENNDLSTPSTEDSSLGDLMMPAYDESSVDTVESLMLPTIPQDSSEDTDSEVGALRFKSSHFNGDGSSTDDEVSLIKDLVFPDVHDVVGASESSISATTAAVVAAAAGNSSVLPTGLREKVAGVIYKTFTSALTRGSSDSSSGGDMSSQTADITELISPSATNVASKDILDSDSDFEFIESEDADS